MDTKDISNTQLKKLILLKNKAHMTLAHYIIKCLQLKHETFGESFPIHAENGTWWSTETGQGGAHLVIDWEQLQQDIEQFEQEFKQQDNQGE